jgi:hypothetical protein
VSVIIIGGGSGHQSITRIVAAGVTGQLTAEQQARFDDLVNELHLLADEIDPR